MNIDPNELIKLTQQLIAIPSMSGDEQAIGDFVAQWLKEKRLVVSRAGVNVIARVSGDQSKHCLILSGHMDTVKPGDVSQWKRDPFSGDLAAGKVFGLGASDMKAGVAASMLLAAWYAQRPVKHDMLFVFVGSEETSGQGTIDALDHLQTLKWFKDYTHVEAIIAEPTNNSFVGIGHRGNQFVTLHVHGDSGHASAPEAITQNVFDYTEVVIKNIDLLVQDWQKTYGNDPLGAPSIGLTQIHAGDIAAPNKIAGSCQITLDVRTTPDLHAQRQQELQCLLKGLPKGVATIEFGDAASAGFCDQTAWTRRAFDSSLPDVPHQPIQGSADLCFFTERGIPTVIFGPGQRERMHAVNESVSATSMVNFCQIIHNVVKKYETYGT